GAPLLLLVPSARVGMPRAATSASVNPRPVNAATALRDIANPAPTSSRRRARSSTVTSQPWRASAIAADSPAIPAPATTVLLCMSHVLPRRAALGFWWALLTEHRYQCGRGCQARVRRYTRIARTRAQVGIPTHNRTAIQLTP